MCWILIWQFVFVMPTGVSVARAQDRSSEYTRDLSAALGDPLLEALNSPEWKATVPSPSDVNSFRASTLVDDDPFFLRHQSWQPNNHEGDGSSSRNREGAGSAISYSLSENTTGAVITLPTGGDSWLLAAPLIPVHQTDSFVFLKAQEHSVLTNSDKPSDGLFVVDYLELLSSQQAHKPVPVYYLPLPGEHWQGGLVAVNEFPTQNLLVFTDNQGDSLPFQLDDLEQIIAVQRMNLMLAQTAALSRLSAHDLPSNAREVIGAMSDLLDATRAKVSSAQQTPSKRDLAHSGRRFTALMNEFAQNVGGLTVYPARGSTAGYGLFYTGFDLDRPGYSEYTQSLPQNIWRKYAQNTIDLVSPSLAHAVTNAAEISEVTRSGETLDAQLVRFAAISGVALVASIALKYTAFKEHFARRRAQKQACADALTPEVDEKTGAVKKPSLWNRFKKTFIGREVSEIGDVYAHTLTLLYQAPGVWFGNAVEFLGDRYWPTVFAGQNRLMRKLLDRTVYFVRDICVRSPVSGYTFFLGLVLGATDTSLYYLQLYHVVPVIAQWIGALIPALQSRIDHAYEIGNPNTAILNQYAVIQCAISYATSGASTVSQSVQGQLLNAVRAEVDDQMRREGKNPENVQNDGERDRRVRRRLTQAMLQMGLPGPDEFLFDATTLYAKANQLVGYGLSKDIYQSEGSDADEGYLGMDRPGLIVPAVKRALKALEERQTHLQSQGVNDESTANAVALMKSLDRDLSFLHSFVAKPARHFSNLSKLKSRFSDVAQTFRRTREQLMALTYEDPSGKLVKNVPAWWGASYGEGASLMAASYFRRAFVSYMAGDPRLVGPTPEDRVRLTDTVTSDAENELIARHRPDYDHLVARGGFTRERAVENLKRVFRLEYDLIVDEQIIKFHHLSEDVTHNRLAYKPPKQSPMTRWQIRKATRLAQEQHNKQYGHAFDATTAGQDGQARWNELYSEATMHTLGLHPDFDVPESQAVNLRESVRLMAEQATNNQIKDDPKLQEYLRDLEPSDRLQHVAQLYAYHATQSYVQATASNTQIPQLSPAQPGRTQRLRQTAWVRKSKVLTRVGRAIDAAFGDSSYTLGLGSFVDRNLPGWADFKLANSRAYRSAITGATIGYGVSAGLWGVVISPAMWTLNLIGRFFVTAPEQYLNRLFRMQDVKLMSGPKTMIMFAFVFSWATFWGSIPIQIFAQDFVNLWNAVGNGLGGSLTQPVLWLREWLRMIH